MSLIALADDLTEDEERQTLAHEIAHHIRGDGYIQSDEVEQATDELAKAMFGL